MSLIQRIKRRTKLGKSRKWTREVLLEMAWISGREYGWLLRDEFYPYHAHDQLAKRVYFAKQARAAALSALPARTDPGTEK